MKKAKALVSVVLSVLMFMSTMIVFSSITSEAAGYIKLKHNMKCSMKQGDYSKFTQPYGYNAGCCAMSYAIGLSIVTGESVEPTQFWYNGTTNYTKGLIGDWEGFNASKIYQSLCNGKPVMAHYNVPANKNNGKESEHWVIVIGANDNSASTSSFICIDPVYGTEKTLNNCWGMGSLNGMKIFTKGGSVLPTTPAIPTIAPTQCVSDGDYHIVTALNNSYGLNVAYNSTAACANVQLQNNMGDDNLTSLVKVKHIGSGYYTITFKNSGKNLDVYNANKTSGTNVWQYDANNNDAQKWIIAPTGDGYFYIITKLNTNLYLDVSGGKAASATNIQVYNGNNSNAQKWKFIASGKPTESTAKSIKDGEYTISTALSSYAGLNIDGGKTDNGANIHLWNNMNVSTNNAIVTVKHLGNGLSSIVFKKSNKALDADSTKNTSGANVQQWSYAGNRNQKWIIKSAGNGYYYIISHSSGLALDAYNAKSSNGTNVAVHLWNKSNAQKWKFNPVKTRITYDPNGGKLYDDTISSTKFSASNSAREAGKIIIYTSNFVSKTTTNQYGDEFSFDKDGKKVGFRAYGSTTGLDIPSGGFVVSKHAESKFDLYNVGRKAQYALCDFNAYTIYFFNNEHDYKIASKLLINGSAYGILPTPIKDGYTFDGWFTAVDGGTKITSTSIFSGTSKLYAHWTKVEEKPSATEEATIPITTVPVTEPATDKPAEPTVKLTEPAEITDSVEPTTTQETPVESQPVQTDPVEFEGDFTYNTKIINYGEITKYIGQTYQLNKDFFKSGRNSEVEITNNKVLTVNSAGKVTFKKAGYTSLYLRYIKDGGDVNAYYDFVVKKPTLNTTKVSLKIGKSFKLRITGKVGKAVFKSNKKRIITVTKSGKIKAKRRGKATITIRTNGNIKLKCKVTVK